MRLAGVGTAHEVSSLIFPSPEIPLGYLEIQHNLPLRQAASTTPGHKFPSP